MDVLCGYSLHVTNYHVGFQHSSIVAAD